MKKQKVKVNVEMEGTLTEDKDNYILTFDSKKLLEAKDLQITFES